MPTIGGAPVRPYSSGYNSYGWVEAMKDRSLTYRYVNPVRPVSIIALIFLGAAWFMVVGRDVIVKHAGISASDVFWTVAMACLAGILLVYIAKGGRWTFEVDEQAVRLGGPFKAKIIRHDDVAFYEIEDHSFAGDPSGSYSVFRVTMKSGAVEKFTDGMVGDTNKVCQILEVRWPYRGRKSV